MQVSVIFPVRAACASQQFNASSMPALIWSNQKWCFAMARQLAAIRCILLCYICVPMIWFVIHCTLWYVVYFTIIYKLNTMICFSLVLTRLVSTCSGCWCIQLHSCDCWPILYILIHSACWILGPASPWWCILVPPVSYWCIPWWWTDMPAGVVEATTCRNNADLLCFHDAMMLKGVTP